MPDTEGMGIEVGIATRIDEDRSLSFRTVVGHTMSVKAQEAMLSSLVGVAAVLSLNEKIIRDRKEIARIHRLMKHLDNPEQHQRKRLAEIAVEMMVQKADIAKSATEMQRVHAMTRQGDYRLVGKDKRKMEEDTAVLEKLEHEKSAIEGDVQRQLNEFNTALGNLDYAIAAAQEEIEQRRKAYGE